MQSPNGVLLGKVSAFEGEAHDCRLASSRCRSMLRAQSLAEKYPTFQCCS